MAAPITPLRGILRRRHCGLGFRLLFSSRLRILVTRLPLAAQLGHEGSNAGTNLARDALDQGACSVHAVALHQGRLPLDRRHLVRHRVAAGYQVGEGSGGSVHHSATNLR